VSSAPSILIVEDEYGLAEMLSEMLSEVGYEVTLAINGQLALDILRERRIDLVLTDAMMPVMDGPELALAMRSSDMYRRIPIVMMTSLPSAIPRMRGLYDGVLSKPFTPEALLKVLDECARRTDGWEQRAADR
jgi:DNA-binding response OmpR family regulator